MLMRRKRVPETAMRLSLQMFWICRPVPTSIATTPSRSFTPEPTRRHAFPHGGRSGNCHCVSQWQEPFRVDAPAADQVFPAEGKHRILNGCTRRRNRRGVSSTRCRSPPKHALNPHYPNCRDHKVQLTAELGRPALQLRSSGARPARRATEYGNIRGDVAEKSRMKREGLYRECHPAPRGYAKDQRAKTRRNGNGQSQGRRRSCQPGKEQNSGQHEPRNPNPNERHHWNDRSPAGHRRWTRNNSNI